MSQPLFVPPNGGFDDALRRTHRRRLRRRATLAATAGSAAVVLVAVLGITGNGPLDSLQQEQPATQGGPRDSDAPSTTPNPSPTRIPTSAAGFAPAVPLTPASPPQIGTRSSSATSAGTTTAGNAPGVSSGPEATAASIEISSPLTRTEHPYSNNSPCADTSGRAATGWCVQFPGPYTGRSGQPTSLSLDLCRLPGVPGATASFPSTAEASFQLSTTSNPPTQLWLLAHQHPAHTARHEITVGSGQCLSWQVTWHNRDDQGHPIAPGDYTLAVSVDADNVADPNKISTQVYRYTVTA
jgi:hypothetical protein